MICYFSLTFGWYFIRLESDPDQIHWNGSGSGSVKWNGSGSTKLQDPYPDRTKIPNFRITGFVDSEENYLHDKYKKLTMWYQGGKKYINTRGKNIVDKFYIWCIWEEYQKNCRISLSTQIRSQTAIWLSDYHAVCGMTI